MASYFQFWGKARPTSSVGPDWHPLAYHCLDVAAVGAMLLERDARLGRRFEQLTGAPFERLRPWLTLFLTLHDLGKFSIAFQQQAPHILERMLGPQSPRPSDVRHDRLGFWLYQWRLEKEWAALRAKLTMGARPAGLNTFDPWWAAVTGHHGRPPDGAPAGEDLEVRFGRVGITAARDFMQAMHALFDPGPLSVTSAASIKTSSWLLAGLGVLADWLGSYQEIFRYRGFAPGTEPPWSLADYWEVAQQQAVEAIEHGGVLPVPSGPRRTFTELFPTITTSSPLQSLCETLPLPPGPQLFVIEDATGAGKTEAALVLIHRLIAAGHCDGFYMAMPTMATANGMYPRIVDVVPQLFERPPSLVLAHSSARLAQHLRTHDTLLDEVVQSRGTDELTDGRPHQLGTASQHATAWLTDSSKKALLAPVGVGTIDQALLAALPANHSSLRQLGLHRKVLVVDEVHACDIYMSKLLDHLLAFQATLGGSVILLSATLAQHQRQRLVEAFTSPLGQAHQVDGTAYPSLVLAHAQEAREHAITISARSTRDVEVEFLHDEARVHEILFDRAGERGGCAAWVKNTVRDAVTTYETLLERAGAGVTVLLFHARFALGHRLAIEQDVLRRFGKHSTPADRAGVILVATQVIEQSLDLDFDDLVSDLAPVDLLIQRAGRLRRHPRLASGERTEGADQRGRPCLRVRSPEWTEVPGPSWLAEAGMKGTARVYPAHAHLWRTMHVIQELGGALRIPAQARRLVEAVYGPEAPTPEGLDAPMLRYEGTQMARESEAAFVALEPTTGYSRAKDGGSWQDDTIARTRLGDESCRLRLGVLVQGAMLPLLAAPGQPVWVAWSLSEVSVRADLVAAEHPADQEVFEQARRSMTDEGKFAVLVALHPVAPGRWQGRALGRQGKQMRPVRVTYDQRTGLEATAAKGELPGLTDPTTTRTFNLLQEPWIPARRRSGRLDWIRPAQVVETDDPVVSIETTRADFDAGLWQFLIGLLQTLFVPADEEEWSDRYLTPPTVDELTNAFAPALDAFWLDGPGPRYMQEQGLEQFKRDEVTIQDVLGEALAARLFFKTETVDRIGRRAAAMALTTLQMHAWGGGRGYKTALRGAGALTTLLKVDGETVFRNLWLNVLSNEDWMASIPGDTRSSLSSAFPWTEPPRRDEQKDLARVSSRSHRATHYWAMPRRAWLLFGPGGRCDLLGTDERVTVATTLRRPYGLSYDGAWLHPLSPHRRHPEDKQLYAARVNDARVPYREWPDLMLGRREDGEEEASVPASVVRTYRLRARGRVVQAARSGQAGGAVGLRFFGYQMPPGQAKVFGWLDQETPLLGESDEEASRLGSHAAQFVAAAEAVRQSLKKSCAEALTRPDQDGSYDPKKIRKALDSQAFNALSRSFWSRTEAAFVQGLEEVRSRLGADDPAVFTGPREAWLLTLHREAMALFAEVSQETAQFSAVDIARVARAHNKLKSDTRPRVPWLREAIGLAAPSAGKAGGRGGKAKGAATPKGKSPARKGKAS